jgi:hypothetical protein
MLLYATGPAILGFHVMIPAVYIIPNQVDTAIISVSLQPADTSKGPGKTRDGSGDAVHGVQGVPNRANQQ